MTIRSLSLATALFLSSSSVTVTGFESLSSTSSTRPHFFLLQQQQQQQQPTTSRATMTKLFAAPSSSNSNRYSTSTSSSSSSTSSSTYVHPAEYDAIVLYPKSEVPFFLQETDDGEVAFAGYVQWDEPCSTIRSIGDVIVAIDGASTAGSSIKEVIQFIQEKARKHAHSFFRFRAAGTSAYDPTTANAGTADSSSGSGTGEDGADGDSATTGRLPGERQRWQLEQEISQIDKDVTHRRAQVDDLNEKRLAIKDELAEIHRLDLEWIEQKRGLLSQVSENPSAFFSDLEQPSSTPAPAPSSTSSTSATTAIATAIDKTPIFDVKYAACIAQVQQAMNAIYSNPAKSDLKYDTLDHVKAVLTKLEKDVKNIDGRKKPETEVLQSCVGIKSDNYHVYVQELRKIQTLLRSTNSNYNVDDSPLTTFAGVLQRLFGPVKVDKINGEDKKKTF